MSKPRGQTGKRVGLYDSTRVFRSCETDQLQMLSTKNADSDSKSICPPFYVIRWQVVGIIDYMRQYDIIKRMERMGKSVSMIAGQAEPTIVQPSLYKTRFQQVRLEAHVVH